MGGACLHYRLTVRSPASSLPSDETGNVPSLHLSFHSNQSSMGGVGGLDETPQGSRCASRGTLHPSDWVPSPPHPPACPFLDDFKIVTIYIYVCATFFLIFPKLVIFVYDLTGVSEVIRIQVVTEHNSDNIPVICQ